MRLAYICSASENVRSWGYSGLRSRMDRLASGGFFYFFIFPEPFSIMPSASTGTHAGGYLAGEGAGGSRSLAGACEVMSVGVGRARSGSQFWSQALFEMHTTGPHMVPVLNRRPNERG